MCIYIYIYIYTYTYIYIYALSYDIVLYVNTYTSPAREHPRAEDGNTSNDGATNNSLSQ